MITVAILINGKPLMARSAINRVEKNEAGETKYETDAGDTIWHKSDEGAAKLGVKLLESIKEPTVTLGKRSLVVVPPTVVKP